MASCLHLITLLSVALGCSAQFPPPGDSCCTRCPPGWTQFGNRCFILHYSQLPMGEAEVVCLKEGGNLASFHNGEEVKFVTDLIKRVSAKPFKIWNGLHDAIKEGQWFWTDGSAASYTNWGKGEPNNNAKGEDCVEVDTAGHFNDLSCTTKRSFMCSKHL